MAKVKLVLLYLHTLLSALRTVAVSSGSSHYYFELPRCFFIWLEKVNIYLSLKYWRHFGFSIIQPCIWSTATMAFLNTESSYKYFKYINHFAAQCFSSVSSLTLSYCVCLCYCCCCSHAFALGYTVISSQKHAGRWVSYSKLPLIVHVCARCPIQGEFLNPMFQALALDPWSVIRRKQLLKMNEWLYTDLNMLGNGFAFLSIHLL